MKTINRKKLQTIKKITKQQLFNNLCLWLSELESEEEESIEYLLMWLNKTNKKFDLFYRIKKLSNALEWAKDTKELLNDYIDLENHKQATAKEILKKVENVEEKIKEENEILNKIFDRHFQDYLFNIIIEIHRNFMWLDYFNVRELTLNDWMQIWRITAWKFNYQIFSKENKPS